jgi:hypothetical protein
MAASLNAIQPFASSLGRVRIHHKPCDMSAERHITRAPARMMPPTPLQLRHPWGADPAIMARIDAAFAS